MFKNALTQPRLLEMAVKPASRTSGVAFPMKSLNFGKFTQRRDSASRSFRNPRICYVAPKHIRTPP